MSSVLSLYLVCLEHTDPVQWKEWQARIDKSEGIDRTEPPPDKKQETYYVAIDPTGSPGEIASRATELACQSVAGEDRDKWEEYHIRFISIDRMKAVRVDDSTPGM